MKQKGFMVQVVEYYDDEEKHIPSDGQNIEIDIATLVGCKVFRAYQPCTIYAKRFDKKNIDEVVTKIKE